MINKTEINNLIDELNNIKTQNGNNKICVAACDEALQLANDLINGKDTKKYLLKITKHGGKMQHINSLSTYKLCCDTCLSLKDNKKTICNKCYADKQLKLYKQLAPCLIYNTLLLKYTKLSARQLPVINDLYFRFESFSDLQNAQHLENLYKIAKYNSNTQFALWTKNFKLIKQYKTPKNINIILSNIFLNACLLDEYSAANMKKSTGAKNVKIFTVYDKKHINTVNFNCARHCIDCLKCYKKHDATMFINELLK